MAMRQFALVAALIPSIAFASYVPGTNTTWNASNACALFLANGYVINPVNIGAGMTAAEKTSAMSKLGGLAMTSGSLTCVASGPGASGKFTLTLTDSKAALADPQFPRWIAKDFAIVMGAHESQIDVWLTAVRRLTTDGRRLTSTVNGVYNVYNPNRGRNIALGIGLGLVAPAIGLGAGLGLGLDPSASTPAPASTPIPASPVPVTTTAAPEEGSSMPLWAGILLGLALLACIGAAVFFGTQKKDKKKRAVKKAAPVREEVRVVEEVVPMLEPMQTYQPAPAFQSVQYVQQAPQVTYAAPAVQTVQAAPQMVRVVEEVVPMLAPMQTYQPAPAFQSVQYVQQAPQVTYAAPAVQTVQAAPQVTYAAPAQAYTSYSRGF